MKPMKLFLLLTFVLFIVGFGITGLLISMESPNYLIVLIQIIMAWTPSMAFAMIHKRIDPSRSLWQQILDRFAKPIELLPLLASILIPVIAILVVWGGYSVYSGKKMIDLVAKLSLGPVLLMFLDTLVRGPLGEELGWRGYLQLELNKRFSVLTSSLIVGLIWGVWHLPLWFISGFQGIDLLLYIIYFMVGLVAFSVIIGYIFSRGGNLFYAILLHLMLNFSGRFLEFDELTVLGGSSAVYLIIALYISVMLLKTERKENAAA